MVQPEGTADLPADTPMIEVLLVSEFEVVEFGGSKSLIITSTSLLGNLQVCMNIGHTTMIFF